MKMIQKGFTLIELMIVVAIIGILAAIAIPQYNDYIARTQVSEAMSLSSGLKTPLAEYYADRGTWPAAVSSVSSTGGGKYVTTLTLAGASGNTIRVDATLKSVGVNAKIKGKVFSIGTNDGGGKWSCGESTTVNAVAAGGTTIDLPYLPAACR